MMDLEDIILSEMSVMAFLGGSLVKKKISPTNAGDAEDPGSIPGSGRSPGRENGNPLQHPCLERHGQRSLAGYSPRGPKE